MFNKPKLGAVCVAVFVAAALLGLFSPLTWGDEAGEAVGVESKTQKPNLLLITIDTLRADYLSCYGYPRETTPNIDRLASEGARFEKCWAPIPLTGPSHASLLTSLYPQEHGIMRNGHKLSKSVTSLAEILKAEGYDTAAFISGWTLRKNIVGLDRGFDVYDDKLNTHYEMVNTERTADDTYRQVSQWLNARNTNLGKPFFLWVHFFDPHDPYREHPEFEHLPLSKAKGARNKSLRQASRYAQEVAFTDRYVGNLLDWFEEKGLTQNTLIAMTADHGESLGEHGYTGHGRQVYEPTMRIPLVFKFDGRIPPGQVIEDPVHLLDVAPTILEFLGLSSPAHFKGQSLAPTLRSGGEVKLAPRELYFETYPGAVGHVPRILRWLFTKKSAPVPVKLGVIRYPYKIIYTPDLDRVEAFHLGQDGEERVNLSERGSQYRDYGERLVQWFHATATAEPSSANLTEDDREKLKSLGYLN